MEQQLVNIEFFCQLNISFCCTEDWLDGKSQQIHRKCNKSPLSCQTPVPDSK